MANAQFDSVLAKKLNTFVALSRDELKCLADLQSNPVKVKRGQQLTQEGQTGHKAFVLQAGWACSFKTAAQRWASDHLVSDRRRHCGSAQRPAANRRSFLLGVDGCGGQSRGRRAHHEVRHRVPAPGRGAAVGRLTRRSHGGRAPGQHRPAQRHRAHGAFLHGAGRTADA